MSEPFGGPWTPKTSMDKRWNALHMELSERDFDVLRQSSPPWGMPVHAAAQVGGTHALNWMLERDPGLFDVADAQARSPLTLAKERLNDPSCNQKAIERSIHFLSAWGARRTAESALDEILTPNPPP